MPTVQVDHDYISLSEAIEKANPSLASKLTQIDDALSEAPDHYSAEVLYKHTVTDHSSVRISSEEWWFNEGELGTSRFRIILGPKGGLDTAEWKDEFTGTKREYTDGRRIWVAWRRILEKIREAR